MIRLANFAGEIPKLIARLLPENHAQIAENVRLDDGALTPMNNPVAVTTASPAPKSIYKWGSTWLSSTVDMTYAPAPVAEDRIYMTGGSKPQMRRLSVTYDLEVRRPADSPMVTVTGSASGDERTTYVYAYSYVTQFGEESEPSPLSNEVTWGAGQTITISGIRAPAQSGRAIMWVRIYRSQTSSTGATDLYFIDDISVPSSTTSYSDNPSTKKAQEPISSLSYNAPPDALRGIIPLPNGMMAAFDKKRLLFCEPWLPHAWPEKYILTAESEIVGLAGFGSAVAVMTKGPPYIVTGTAPENMLMEKLEVTLPCVSAKGIVDLGPAVAYPSTDGLVLVDAGGARIVSEGLVTPAQWKAMKPETFIAGRHGGKYVAAFDGGAANRGVLVFDLSGGQPFISRRSDYVTAMHNDAQTGALYVVTNGTTIYEWDSASGAAAEMKWRSKKFVSPTYLNYGAILIEGGTGARTDTISPGVAVIADGVTVATITRMNSVQRLPGKSAATTYEVEVRGKTQITAISLGFSPEQLASGGA